MVEQRDAISATFLENTESLETHCARSSVARNLAIESLLEAADETVAAIMLEPIQSMAGVRMAESAFYRQLREIAKRARII